jgi:SAM-dependent methyltransferase
MENSEYRKELLRQLGNANSPGIQAYFTWLYSQVENEIFPDCSVLEIGAGAGISKLFMKNSNVLRTDLLDHDLIGVQSGVNAEDLPFSNEQFDAAIAVDMFHHVPFPHKVLSEMVRVTSARGKIIIVEPYVSLLSVFFYKLFHSEKTSILLKYSQDKPMVGIEAADGDQVICQRMFFSRVGRSFLEKNFGNRLVLKRYLISPMSFFLTGGINRPIQISPRVIRLLISIESKIPNLLMKLMAARQIIVLEKVSSRT